MRDWKQDLDHVGLMKAGYWEIAKGYLRATVQTSGAIPSNARRGCGGDWKGLSKKVEEFISDVEDHGLQE